MSLADKAAAIEPRQRGPKCWYVRLDLSDEDRAFLDELLASSRQHAEISRILKADGHAVRQDMVRWHRNGDCACR